MVGNILCCLVGVVVCCVLGYVGRFLGCGVFVRGRVFWMFCFGLF